ncbi:MAG TPA: hypothetical protein VN892_00125 [Solirubrobacteraceae bacterium]|nr:hypothetical protein [Solirubrobacteraceae bacterium]
MLAAAVVVQRASVAPVAAAERFWWRPAVLIDPPSADGRPAERLGLVACASPTLCVAADGRGNVFTSTDPTGGAGSWSVGRVDYNSLSCGLGGRCAVGFSSLSCPSRSLCVAVDLTGDVFWTTDPAGGPVSWHSAKITSTELIDVSCPSTSLCVAVDYSGDAVWSTSPTSGPSAWQVAKIDEGPCPNPVGCFGIGSYENRALNAVSCASVSLCVASDMEGDAVVSTDPEAGADSWQVAHVDNKVVGSYTGFEGNAGIGSVACPSDSLCVASDDDEDVLTSQDPSGGAGAWKLTRVLTTTHGLSDLTCPSASLCLALGGGVPSEALLNEQPADGSRWLGSIVESTGVLSDISCPSISLCMAVDEAGDVIAGLSFSLAAIQRRVRSALIADRKPPAIHALLQSGRFTSTFAAPADGTLFVRWRLLRGDRATRLVVAAGQQLCPRIGAATFTIGLSRAGIRLLAHDSIVQVQAEGVFYPSEGGPIRATRRIALGR